MTRAATREGLFDLSSFPHALFFGGIALAVVGLLTLVFGTWIYKPGRVTVGRRLLQVGAPIAAIALVGGCAAIADGSQYADPHARRDRRRRNRRRSGEPTTSTRRTDGEAEMNAADSAKRTRSRTRAKRRGVPPKKYDPTLPIDLGGVEGVTPEQQARAENLIAITLLRLPQCADYKVAEAAGFRSIGDAATGDEHFINIAYFDDGAHPRPGPSRVARVRAAAATARRSSSPRCSCSAPNQTLDDVPDVGGTLTQWHIHNNLCFTAEGRVAGLSNGRRQVPRGAELGQRRLR